MLTAIMQLLGIDLEHKMLVLKGHARELMEGGTSRLRQEMTDASLTVGLAAFAALAASATIAVGLAMLFLWVERDNGPLIALSAVAGVTAVIAIVTFAIVWRRASKPAIQPDHPQPLSAPPTPPPAQPTPLDLSSLVPPPPANASIVDLLTHRFAHRVAIASDEAIDTATGLVRQGSRGTLFGTLILAAAVGVLVGRRRQHPQASAAAK